MEEKEFNTTFAIPANYTDSGKIFGGMLEPRNAVEALILILAVGYPELMLIPMATTIRIVVMTVTLIPIGILAAKSITRKADSDKHIAMLRKEMETEESEQCKKLSEGYIRLIKDVGSREALTRRFFLIFRYEELRRNENSDYGQICSTLLTTEQNARAYFMQCGNNILQPKDPDEATAEILYMFFNRRSCVEEPFHSRVDRIVLDTMAAKNKVIGIDPIPHIRMAHFIAPRGIDLMHRNYIIMDGLYYSFLYIKGNGYPNKVRAGWMSSLINAGEGIDVDVFLRRENRSKTIDKVAQRIRLNRTKLKSMQDTSTDYEELAGSIQAGYFIKQGIANYNEDLFYMSVFVTVSARTYEELMWRKQQMTDMLKSMDMYVSDCSFQQEDALRTVMPFLQISPKLEKKSKRNVLTSGAASTYMFTSFEMSDDTGVLLGINRHNNSLCIVDLFDTKKNKNANLNLLGTSGAGKTFTMQLLALRMRMRGIQCYIIAPIKGHEFRRACNRIGGQFIKIAPGSPHCININLVSPEHSDSWNCMSDLNGDTLMAQVLTNVIIGNTSSGKGDHFWDNGEGNLLKALILLIDQDRTRSPDMKHLSAVYQLLTQNSERQLTAMFDKLPLDHPARAPFNLFAQSSDTVRSGIILGLGTRLQVLQNQAVQRITSRSDIDLTAPGRNKCIYYIVLSDQDATMAFLSSLFFSFMFIKLTRYADGRPNGRCDVPVNLILDEFNNVGRIGGAEDGSDFARSLSVVRSRDIRVMLAVQSLGQLQNRYPKNLWAEIIGNCDIQLMLGCTDDVTAEYISARSGDMSVQVNSTMTVRQTIAVAQVIPQYRHTEGQGRRRLLTPDEVLRLPNEELLCIIRGHNILKLNKLDFTRHPMAKQIVKASVYDYQPAADTLTPTPTQSDTEPVPPKKAARRKSLYSSAQPPSEF